MSKYAKSVKKNHFNSAIITVNTSKYYVARINLLGRDLAYAIKSC